ncbi:MAG: ferritin-like domain-containing protein [Myxococcota bacterium]
MAHVPPNPHFRALVAATLALAACAPKSAPAPTSAPEGVPGGAPPLVPAPGPKPTPCELQQGPTVGTNLRPVEPVDALAFAVANPMKGAALELRPITGQVCADGPGCVAPLVTEALHQQCGQIGCIESTLVWSREGVPGAATNRTALLEFLGPIDSRGEANLLAWVGGYSPTACPTKQGAKGVWKVTVNRRVSDCPVRVDSYDLDITPSGELTVKAHRKGASTSICIGRLPAGLGEVPEPGVTVGSWLARAAHLEAASVQAFDQLHAELVFHQAPKALQRAALACREDEVRHAKLMGDLARAWGATVAEPVVTATPVRTLVAIALDNAEEGCGREAWGALVGHWQSLRADDPAIRRVVRSVAQDEVRHAEFSFALDAWLRTRLTSAECARVDRTVRRSRRRLATEARLPVPEPMRRVLGLPDANEAATLWAALRT